MEERGQSNSTGQHKLILQNRKSGSFTGVTDVVNFDANEIILDTELGRLTIKGKELHVNRLDLQKKEVEIRDNTKGVTFKAHLELSDSELEVISCGGQLRYLKKQLGRK